MGKQFSEDLKLKAVNYFIYAYDKDYYKNKKSSKKNIKTQKT